MIFPSRILFEDEHLLIVDKLPRELTVAGSGKVDRKSLFDYLKPDYPGLTVVHRLDFETSGVVVFAKSKKVGEDIVNKNLIQNKTYHALTNGVMRKLSGKIEKKLRSRSDGKPIEATSEYKVLEQLEGLTLVEVVIQSGRRHQVRQHLAMIGYPLILDDVYGDKKYNHLFEKAFGLKHFFLHAASVEITHPDTGEKLTVSTKRPKAYEKVLEQVRS